MAMWKESKNGTAELEIEREDLIYSNILLTKNVFSEILDYKAVLINFQDGHSCDGAGMQLLLFFIREIKQRGGEVNFCQLNGKSEWEKILTLFGIQEYALCREGER